MANATDTEIADQTEYLNVKLTGTTPLLHNSIRLDRPANPVV